MNPLSPIRTLPSLAESPFLRPDARRAGSTPAVSPAEIAEIQPAAPAGLSPAVRGADGSFSGLLGRMVTEVNAKQNTASQAVADLQSGKPVSLHQAMIAMEEASVSFQLMAEVRNRLLESYQELMRMQV